jgi:hypothetical protein
MVCGRTDLSQAQHGKIGPKLPVEPGAATV